MNHSDSERIATFLESRGFVLSENMDDAQLIIINTCGIRKAAEDRVYSTIHNIRKKPSPQNLTPRTSHLEPRIIVTGCIAHRKDVQKRLRNNVDLFCDIKNFPRDFNKFLSCHPERSESVSETESAVEGSRTNMASPNKTGFFASTQNDRDYLSIYPKHESSFQAFVPIMTGCNNFCTYCVVPYARGREVSRPADEIIGEIKDLVKKGYKHIVLLGQNVNSYKSQVHKVYKVRNVHKEKTEEIDFAQLLKKINKIPGKFWITFVSSHPKDMSDDLIETIAKCKKVCECVHLPVQAGNDEILKRMNRKYTQAHYLKVIRKIKSAFAKIREPLVPISISTDIIVGFPGETRAQFADSTEVMKKARYDMVYFGQFSPRPGTVAWKMKDNVSKKEKERREKILNEILKETAFANNKKYVGKIVEVLIDHVKSDKKSDHVAGKNLIYFGKTRTMKNIKITTNKKIPVGSFVKVKVTKVNVWNLEGNA